MPERRFTEKEMADFDRTWRAGGDVNRLLRGEDTATPAGLGLPLQLGDLDLTFNPLTISYLGLVESPFVMDGDGDLELSQQDVANAVYVVSVGADAVRPIMGYRQRRAVLNSTRARLEELGPEYVEAWLREEMKLADVWRGFELAALEYWTEHCAYCSLQDVADAFVTGLRDAMEWDEAVQSVDSGAKKKPPGRLSSMWNGWVTRLVTWWPWASPTTRRSTRRSARRDGSPSASAGPAAKTSPPATAD